MIPSLVLSSPATSPLVPRASAKFLRYFLGLFLLFSAVEGAFAMENPPPAVSFDGKTLVRAHEKSDKGTSVAEYVPKGETLERWNRLAAYFTFSEMNDPKMLALSIARSIQEKSPQTKYTLAEHPRTKDVILDFLVSPQDGSFTEFNIFRIAKEGGDGLLLQQYALRAYGKDIKPFLKALPDERERLLELMAKTGLQKLK